MSQPKLTDRPIFDAPPLPLTTNLSGYAVASDQEVIENSRRHEASIPVRDPAPFSVYPSEGIKVSNRTRNNTIGYCYGINTQYPLEDAISLANIRGKSVMLLPNTTDGFAKDMLHAFYGAFIERLGTKAEAAAIFNTVDFLKDQLVKGDYPVEIYAYSQGNLIVNRALDLLAYEIVGPDFSSLSKTEKNARLSILENLASNIHIYRYGSPDNTTPAAAKSLEFKHALDPVAALSPLVGKNKQIWDWRGGLRRADTKVISINNERNSKNPFIWPLEDHSIAAYLNNNPEFYGKSMAHLSPKHKALLLSHSIQSGFFSDQEYERIIYSMSGDGKKPATISEKQFSSALLSLAGNGSIGEFKFSESLLKHLQSLALDNRR